MLGQNWRQIDRRTFQRAPAGAWRDLPVTDKQRAVLELRGVDATAMTRGEAFELIRAWGEQNGVRIRRTAT